MRAKLVDRIWLGGGALVTVGLIALTWFFLISPKDAERDGVRAQSAVAEVKVASLQRRLTELRKQQAELPRYEAELVEQRLALPTEIGSGSLLLDMRDAGAATEVLVTQVMVEPAVKVAGTDSELYQLPITLISEGTGPNQERFLTQLQQIRPRAILITAANLTAGEASGGFAGKITMTLTVHVFVAPENVPAATPTGGAAPTPSPTE